ncbi:hypothetical protein SAY86_009346 [Trapa natans]|uniref:GDSL esterase/lipase n=1 Tax=Trapa natans TaxID=22666 RepID=A0AAN7L4A8_TRANT|nr:hypothetical protein SAY86_009346 [Trapa natans]
MASRSNSSMRIFLLFCFFTQCIYNAIVRAQQVPCYFIFGDSLADPGNNNNLITQAKANYQPYGVDFSAGPTGRFTNNRTLPDVIGQLLGFPEFIPPFANTAGKNITKGVNYASAVSGIRDETGKNQGDRVSLNKQLLNHLTTYFKIRQILGSGTATSQHFGKCIYVIITGNNDYINNYFMPNMYLTSRLYTPQQYADVLAAQYTAQLKVLYSLGARKVAVFGVGLIGSAPQMITRFGANSTNVSLTAQLFSNKLPGIVNNLNSLLPGAKFTFINVTGITITSPPAPGLNTTGTCCQLVQNLGTCVPGSTPCPNRSLYAFFDGFHPSDVVNAAFGQRAYTKQLATDASPYSIQQLSQLP